MISGFRHEVDENCALLGYHAASRDIFFYRLLGPMFFPMHQFYHRWSRTDPSFDLLSEY